MTGFLVTWFGFIQLYESIRDFTIDFPLNIFVAILWWTLIWKGTRFEILFSRTKRVAILTLFVVEMAISGYQIYKSIRDFYDEPDQSIDIINNAVFVDGFNLAINVYVYSILLYYAYFVRDFRFKINNIDKKLV